MNLTPDFQIVQTEHNDNFAYAALTLQEGLRQAAGVTGGFEIVKLQTAGAPSIVLQFASLPASKVDYSGFRIYKSKNIIYLQVRRYPVGTSVMEESNMMHAATHFLDVCCNIRNYLPGSLWWSKPERLQVPDSIDLYSKPFVKYVSSTGFDNFYLNGVDAPEYQWARLHGYIRRNGDMHQHTLADDFPEETGGGQPDFTNPALLPKALAEAQEHFIKNPHHEYFSLAVMDNDAYHAGDQQGAMHKLVRDLALQFKKKLPGKKVLFLGYGRVAGVPMEPMPDNVVAISVFRIAESTIKGVHYHLNKQVPSSVMDWLDVVQHHGVHDWAQGRGYFFPRVYSGHVSRLMKLYRDKNKPPYLIHAECYPNWGVDGPKLWIMSRLYWKADLDPDYLLMQFCKDMFGNVWQPMLMYWWLIEELSDKMNNNATHYRKMFVMNQFKLYGDERKIHTEALIQAMHAKAVTTNETVKKRIDFFLEPTKAVDYLFGIANSTEVTQAKVEEARAQGEKVARMPMAFYDCRVSNFMAWYGAALDAVSSGKVKG